jgi:DNA invertase Pin-like site-specific DNA recombinase
MATPDAEPAPASKRAIGYIRVSQSRPDMISPEIQEQHIRAHCAKHRYDYLGSLQDLDASGRTFGKRPGLTQAIGMLATDEADVIVVWKWSRFARKADEAQDLLHVIEAVLGGAVESASESTGPSAREMHLQIAEYESARAGEMWRDAHARRLEMGLPHSGSARLGYHMVRSGSECSYIPDREERGDCPAPAAALAQCFTDYIAGAGFGSLAGRLNAQGVTTTRGSTFTSVSLRATMDSGFAAGLLAVTSREGRKASRQFLRGKHEPIVDMATWRAYQRERSRRRDRARRAGPNHPSLLAGIARCPYCGGRLHARGTTYSSRSGRKEFRSYACAASVNGRGCAGTSMSVEQLDSAVLAWVDDAAGSDSSSRQNLRLARADAIDQLGENAKRLARAETVDEAAALREERLRLLSVARELADAQEQLDSWAASDRGHVVAANRSLRLILHRVFVARGRPGVRTRAEERLTVEPVWQTPGAAAPAAAEPPPDRQTQPRPGETEVRLLQLLASAGMTALDLARELELTPVAIRRQLSRLLSVGSVVVVGSQLNGRGRSARVYRATDRALAFMVGTPQPPPQQ